MTELEYLPVLQSLMMQVETELVAANISNGETSSHYMAP